LGQAPALDEAAYRLLHRDLLDACKAHVVRAGQAQAGLFKQIEELVKPWLTHSILEKADRETITSLHKQCSAISARLGHGGLALWSWAFGLLLLLMAVAAGYFVMQTVGNVPSVNVSAVTTWVQRNPF